MIRPVQALTITAVLQILLLAGQGFSQQSDYQVMSDFNARHDVLKGRIDSARTAAQLDSIGNEIKDLEHRFASRSKFLNRALYPETFEEKINSLHSARVLVYDRISLVQNLGQRLAELEARILYLTGRLDTLTVERNRLFEDLETSKQSLATMETTMRRLSMNLSTNERLLFALIDSMFLPYNKDMTQVAEVQKAALSKKLQKSDIVTRIYDVAADNMKFLEVTKLQGKDYSPLIDHYQQFRIKWTGLGEKINAVYQAAQKKTATRKPTRKGKEAPPGAHVDSALTQWEAKLTSAFWKDLATVFVEKGVSVRPFSDAESFAGSIRSHVDSVKARGDDASVFVNDIWKVRIDREWREALSKDVILGKEQYASLDKLVSELGQKRIDTKFLIYIAAVLAIIGTGWWFLKRKPGLQNPGAAA